MAATCHLTPLLIHPILSPTNRPHAIIDMTMDKAALYTFQKSWGWKEAQRDMIEANCVSSRLTAAWVQNHYSLIVWKIACLIRSYPDHFMDQWQSKSVLNQLLYRYEREVNLGQRPVLRKILEQDDNSVKHMVLFVANIIKTQSSSFYNTCEFPDFLDPPPHWI